VSQKKSRLSEYQRSLWLEIVNGFLKLPRLARIILVAVFALTVTLALSPLVDYVYIRYMFTEQTRLLPSLVSAGAGIAMYLLGWWLVIGSVNARPSARPAILVYLIFGIFAVCLVLILGLMGLSSATAPTI